MFGHVSCVFPLSILDQAPLPPNVCDIYFLEYFSSASRLAMKGRQMDAWYDWVRCFFRIVVLLLSEYPDDVEEGYAYYHIL
jgi:hypothetical protein